MTFETAPRLRFRVFRLAALALVLVGGVLLLRSARSSSQDTASRKATASQSSPTAATGPWLHAVPDYEWSFPRDHWAHAAYKTEWWYFTGHLRSQADPQRWFGYQFTFFRFGLLPEPAQHDSNWDTGSLIMGHAAISDLARGQHVFSEILYRAVPLLGGFGSFPDSLIAWSRGPAGTAADWTLRWNGAAFDFEMVDAKQELAFALSTRPTKGLVLQGPAGYSRKGPAATQASQYYSYTRLATAGTLTVAGESIPVRGESWMDQEFASNQLSKNQIGWDWYSLQLRDGREVMLYALRDRDGKIDFARGTVISPAGEARHLGPEDWTSEALATWVSPQTEAAYPAAWRIQVPSAALDLSLQPLLQAQENVGRSLYYWEGAVSILDQANQQVGRGYVELTGYGHDNRPPM